jgi:hypothetical protein
VSDTRILSERRQALEDAFFARQEAQQLSALRSKLEAQKTREELKTVSGIDDDAVLDRLVELELTAKDIAALSIIPLIQVAWADGSLKPAEREAVLKAAHEQGIAEGSHTHQLLDHWLEELPAADLYQAWHGYVESLATTLSDVELDVLRENLLGMAHDVASAAGGILGIHKISAEEQKILTDIEATLSR